MRLPRVSRRTIIGLMMAAVAVPAAATLRRRKFYEVEWLAVSLAGTPFAEEALPTFRIGRDGKYSGRGGCNRYGGQAVVKGRRISPGNAFSTRMACMGPGGDNETRFLGALSKATAWRFEGPDLVMETAQGPLRFRRK